jgi:hypothetical protein
LHNQFPTWIQDNRFDKVSAEIQRCQKQDLHPSFRAVAVSGWQTNASFADRVWRLARFFNRISKGDMLSYSPKGATTTPVVLVRTGVEARRQFSDAIKVSMGSPICESEPEDFGISTVFFGFSRVVMANDTATHHTICTSCKETIAQSTIDMVLQSSRGLQSQFNQS